MGANIRLLRRGVLLVLFLVTDGLSCAVEGQYGTTCNFTDIFISRCERFQNDNPEPFKDNRKNCTLLLELFLHSIANKTVCDVNQNSYSEFFREANHTLAITNKAMFWSLVFPFVYNFADSEKGKYTTILNLLPGYVLNDLKWCWSLAKNDLNYTSCPSYKDCPAEKEAVRSFWKTASQNFASLAAGTVYAMLNGSTTVGAFNNGSLFYTVEVPTMNSPRITTMQAILVQNLDGPFSEFCYNGTLTTLANDLKAKGIKFECIANPPEVKKLQCMLYPQYSKYCPTSASSVLLATLSSPLYRISLIVAFRFASILM